jgi:hypothetical protein
MKFISLLVFFLCLIFFSVIDVYSQTFQTGKIAVSMSDYGRVRVIKDSLAGLRQIDRSSFLAGIDTGRVFSYKLSAETEDSMRNIQDPLISDHEIYGSINNTYDTTGNSPDFHVKHNVYGWDGEGYILVKFTVINRESGSLNTILGMEMIAQTDGSYGLETVEYLSAEGIIALYRLPTSTYTGYKILSHPLTSLKIIEWYSGYNNLNPDLFNWLNYGQLDTLYDSGGDGAVTFFSKEAVNIAAGDSAVFWVGISVGENEADMTSNMALAETRYGTLVGVEKEDPSLPSSFSLHQNYPNPFNPSTTIQFSIPQTEFVSLKVYDILGNKVADLANETLSAGNYSIKFNPVYLSSGIYFYQLTTGSYSETKKMNFIK